MAKYCKNCGTSLDDDARFCPSCGTAAGAEPVRSAEPVLAKETDPNLRVMGVLAYIGILFLVPMLAAKDSEFAKFHANQGLLLFLLWIVSATLLIIPILGWIASFAGYVFGIVCLILGIVRAANGEMIPLPLIGKLKILN